MENIGRRLTLIKIERKETLAEDSLIKHWQETHKKNKRVVFLIEPVIESLLQVAPFQLQEYQMVRVGGQI